MSKKFYKFTQGRVQVKNFWSEAVIVANLYEYFLSNT